MTFAWNKTQLDCSSSIILMSETLLQTLDFATCFITFSTANLIFSLQLQIYRSVFAFWSLKNLAVNSAKAHRTLFKFTFAGRGGLMDHRGLWWSTVTHPVIYFKQNGLMWRGPGKKLAFKSGHTNGPLFFFSRGSEVSAVFVSGTAASRPSQTPFHPCFLSFVVSLHLKEWERWR